MEKQLKRIDEKLRILILMTLGYEGEQRKQIEYFVELGLSIKQIGELLKVEEGYIAKEKFIIKQKQD